MRNLLLIFFSLLPGALSCSSSVIPKVFHGTWDKNDDACRAQHSDMRLNIRPSAVEYWESSGTLIEMVESNNRSLTARFTFSGEGESWERNMTYFVLNEGNTLVQALDDGSKVSRIRCTVQ